MLKRNADRITPFLIFNGVISNDLV